MTRNSDPAPVPQLQEPQGNSSSSSALGAPGDYHPCDLDSEAGLVTESFASESAATTYLINIPATSSQLILDTDDSIHYFEEKPGPTIRTIPPDMTNQISKSALEDVTTDALIIEGTDNNLFATPAAASGMALAKARAAWRRLSVSTGATAPHAATPHATVVPAGLLRDIALHIRRGAYRILFKLVEGMIELKVAGDRNNPEAYGGKSNTRNRPYGFLKEQDGEPPTKNIIRNRIANLLQNDSFLGIEDTYLQRPEVKMLLGRVFYGKKTGYSKTFRQDFRHTCPERAVLALCTAIYEVLLNRTTGNFMYAATNEETLSEFYEKIAAELGIRKLDPMFCTAWTEFLQSIPRQYFVA
ncbi:hypothetical protein BJ138DRAFT_1119444 [Hygrophoropsis aurantiaca]|uniref:Uncharacterized protein n=1 Tax=Hygrophoropsis aurantiaca TaxID=72124 RepID=A0ACB7ZU68_9AGAM|nr:hypothetical protein BJ138DRAFT_1119444 [Hygrophoropsis aurantiaca]